MPFRNPNMAEYGKQYARRMTAMLEHLDGEALTRIADAFLQAREEGRRIFFIGNGGSAATASHFASDIGIGTCCPEKPFKAVCLTDNVAVLTALGNDYGFEDVFVRQLSLVMESGDLLLAISASGNSPNILKAVEWANERSRLTIGLTGFDGGRLRRMCRVNLHVASEQGEYGPVENMHLIVNHLLMAYLMKVVHGKDVVAFEHHYPTSEG